jgi:mono/diheme cytochrome c family protein
VLALAEFEILLLAVALAFVAFALVVALVVPRSRPEFPAPRLGLFIGVCVLFFVAQMGAVLALVEFGHAESGEPEETAIEQEAEGDAASGKGVFLGDSACGSCHTLSDAGTTGAVGPNLDATQPSYELVVDRVTDGAGGMPAFSDSLTEEQIADVAAYVTSVAGT